MPKNKTHSGTKKRFRLTGSGKVMREQANRRHLFEGKPSKRTRALALDVETSSADVKKGLVMTQEVVRLSGDVDLAAVDAVQDTLMQALSLTNADQFEVDLAAVPFLDSSGIRVLIQARKYATERGIGFSVSHATDPVVRVVATLGLQDYLGLRS